MKANIILKANELWMLENNLTYQELSNIGDAHVLLEVIIQGMKNDLDKYSKSSNAKEFFINKKKELIASLIEVSQIQKFYLFHDYLVKINETIMSLLSRDPDLSGLNLSIVFNNRNSVFAYEVIRLNS